MIENYPKNNTMAQNERIELWCCFCKNENTENCAHCVFAGLPTRYSAKRFTVIRPEKEAAE